jgi:hypothetical protein
VGFKGSCLVAVPGSWPADQIGGTFVARCQRQWGWMVPLEKG